VRQARSPRHRSAEPVGATKTLLWIDDYEPALMAYQALLAKYGFRVIPAVRPAVGLQVAASQTIDAVITDYEMPEINGAAVAKVLKRRHPELPVILFTATDPLPNGIKHLCDACCDKAAPLEQLLATLNRLLLQEPRPSLQPQALRPSSEQGQRALA
jgi:DNA-binding NtrC family response regulator